LHSVNYVLNEHELSIFLLLAYLNDWQSDNLAHKNLSSWTNMLIKQINISSTFKFEHI